MSTQDLTLHHKVLIAKLELAKKKAERSTLEPRLARLMEEKQAFLATSKGSFEERLSVARDHNAKVTAALQVETMKLEDLQRTMSSLKPARVDTTQFCAAKVRLESEVEVEEREVEALPFQQHIAREQSLRDIEQSRVTLLKSRLSQYDAVVEQATAALEVVKSVMNAEGAPSFNQAHAARLDLLEREENDAIETAAGARCCYEETYGAKRHELVVRLEDLAKLQKTVSVAEEDVCRMESDVIGIMLQHQRDITEESEALMQVEKEAADLYQRKLQRNVNVTMAAHAAQRSDIETKFQCQIEMLRAQEGYLMSAQSHFKTMRQAFQGALDEANCELNVRSEQLDHFSALQKDLLDLQFQTKIVTAELRRTTADYNQLKSTISEVRAKTTARSGPQKGLSMSPYKTPLKRVKI